MAFSSRIWEGRDYLPRVFDAWLADGDGEFDAVLLDGRVVGCGKLTFFTPAMRGWRGCARTRRCRRRASGALSRCISSPCWPPGPGLASVRFSTSTRNRASITTNERLGFQRRMTLTRMSWQGGRAELEAVSLANPAASASAPEVVTVRDESLVYDFLVRFGCFRDTAGLVVDGWQARPFSPELLAERYVRTGCCRGILSDEGLAGLVIARFDERVLRPPTEDRLSRCAGHFCRRRTVR